MFTSSTTCKAIMTSQLSVANSSSRHRAAVASDRFKSALEECRAELAKVTAVLKAGQDDLPAFFKTFRIAADKGDIAVPCLHCLTSSVFSRHQCLLNMPAHWQFLISSTLGFNLV